MRTDPVYDADIYVYMRYRELKLCPSGDFLDFQEEICGEVRCLLVEWICDSAREFNLSTVYFTFLKCLLSNFAFISKKMFKKKKTNTCVQINFYHFPKCAGYDKFFFFEMSIHARNTTKDSVVLYRGFNPE